MNYKKRIEKFQKELKEKSIEAILISNIVNCCYLSGFSGSNAYILITPEKAMLLTDFRYIESAVKEAPFYDIIDYGLSLELKVLDLLRGLKVKRLNFEEEHISVAQHNRWLAALSGISLIPCKKIVENLRKIKDKEEIEAIKFAAKVSDEALEYIVEHIEPGKTENEIALELTCFVKKRGVEMYPKFIVASGFRSALPHGYYSDKVIESGDLLMIDFGAHYNGYFSDITRTFVVGKASKEQLEIYDIVKQGQKRALNTTKAGVSLKDSFRSAASIIEEKGYILGHGLGHGVGLDVHELPFINEKEGNEGVIENSMVFTIEPGVYIPGWGGVRIEDTVVVKGDSCYPLTHFRKEIIEIE